MIISQEQFRDYYDNEIFITSSGTPVVCVPVEYNGYDRQGRSGRWQDAHKEIAVGLYIIHKSLSEVGRLMKSVVGYAIPTSTIFRWVRLHGVLVRGRNQHNATYQADKQAKFDLVVAHLKANPNDVNKGYAWLMFKLKTSERIVAKAIKHAKALHTEKL